MLFHAIPTDRAGRVSIDVQSLRARFPTLQRLAYLNSGSYGLLSDAVEAAVRRYLDDRIAKGADWGGWMDRMEAVRQGMAALLNARTEEVAVTASASAGINAIASALDFAGPRNRVVVSNLEFPTSAQIWHAQAPRGAVVDHVPEAADGSIPLEHFERLIDERTAVVAITQVCYRNGARIDVEGVVRLARSRGALVLLDCFQAIGALTCDVQQLGVDFAVGGMLKYLLGAAGIGFLYAARRHHERLLPTVGGWFAQADIDAMDIFANAPAKDARRFQAGTPPVINCYAAEAGIGLIRELGTQAIEDRILALTGTCMDRLAGEGLVLATPREDARRGPLVAIRAKDDNALVARLAERDVVVSCRDSNLRAMFHAYNDEGDIDRLVEGLAANRELLAEGD